MTLIHSLAEQDDPSSEEVDAIVALLNSVIVDPRLNEGIYDPEEEKLVVTLRREDSLEAITQIARKLSEQPNDSQSERLNRLLLAAAYP